MKSLFYISFCLLLASCKTKVSDNYQDITIEKEQAVDNANSFTNDFLIYFETETYPYQLKYGTNRLSYFDRDILNALDVDVTDKEVERTSQLSTETIKSWILNSEQDTKLTKWFDRTLDQIDDDWYSVQPGVKLENDNSYYVIVYTYEQTSAVNGGYWTVWLLEYTKSGELLKTVELGDEGLYSFVDMKDTETDSYWKRHTNNEMLHLNFKQQNDIKICRFKWTEIEGDIDVLSPDYYNLETSGSTIQVLIKDQIEKCWDLSDSLD